MTSVDIPRTSEVSKKYWLNRRNRRKKNTLRNRKGTSNIKQMLWCENRSRKS